MAKTVEFRKYTNRRLYLLGEQPRYVTLLEVAEAVIGGADVLVKTHPDNIDVTREALIDAFRTLELRTPRMSRQGIQRLIRFGLPAA